jgi:DNA-binding transcriptional LysR family regulator
MPADANDFCKNGQAPTRRRGTRVDYFAAMRAFAHVVELGSFSKAAEEEGIKVSTVSRYISALESDLGASLFNRSTRALHLTEAGRHFHANVIRILDDLTQARLAATSLNARPQGLLRLNIPVVFGCRHIVPHLADFMAEYPDIRVDVTLADETVELIASGCDLAIRIGVLTDSRLIAKRLAPHRRALVASPAYLQTSGAIKEPRDLENHQCVLFALQPRNTWYFLRDNAKRAQPQEVAVHGRFRANHSEALLDAALAGLGIALLPTWLTGNAIADGRLVTVLNEWHIQAAAGPTPAIWGVYPPKKVVPPKVRAFLAFIEQRFGDPPYWSRMDAHVNEGT